MQRETVDMHRNQEPDETGEAASWIFAMLLLGAIAAIGFGAGWFVSP